MNDSDRRVLLLGAGGLIGSACASMMAASGMRLLLAGRDAAKLEKLRARLPGRHEMLSVNLGAEPDASLLEHSARFNPDTVVWAVRMDYPSEPVSNFSGDITASASVSLKNLQWLIQRIVPLHREARFGRWIFISSIISRLGGPGQSAYVIEKKAIEGLSRNIALEEGVHGITSNVILAGIVSGSDRHNVKALVEMNALKRAALPEEIAHAVQFLSQPLAGSVTGVELPVCGGADLAWFLRKE